MAFESHQDGSAIPGRSLRLRPAIGFVCTRKAAGFLVTRLGHNDRERAVRSCGGEYGAWLVLAASNKCPRIAASAPSGPSQMTGKTSGPGRGADPAQPGWRQERYRRSQKAARPEGVVGSAVVLGGLHPTDPTVGWGSGLADKGVSLWHPTRWNSASLSRQPRANTTKRSGPFSRRDQRAFRRTTRLKMRRSRGRPEPVAG